ncbi:hypothetical protein [uncultured Lutibacter sp.]|uniref:hypothetical protein n=1 Tax=uncultured Lutibacter sp. TaxID=437739 RepID=UPI002633F236|nr:hypothetical protein [uncultured Lutibacter sp.]
MGLFEFFNKKNKSENLIENIEPSEAQFVDDTEPQPENESIIIYNLDEIYDYASVDFEQRGYQDALTNPDTSYKEENIDLLLMDLGIKIERAIFHYSNLLQDLEFHIKSRKDAGLIDTVNQLESQKEKTLKSSSQVKMIKDDFENNEGLSKRIRFSYKRGFNRGLASMSTNLLNSI